MFPYKIRKVSWEMKWITYHEFITICHCREGAVRKSQLLSLTKLGKARRKTCDELRLEYNDESLPDGMRRRRN
jgi:hypothetical protein